jgi:hypothetical protein
MRIKYVDLQKCYSVELGEALPVVLHPAVLRRTAVSVGCRAWRSFAQMGEGSTERAVATHTLAQEAWAFARPLTGFPKPSTLISPHVVA